MRRSHSWKALLLYTKSGPLPIAAVPTATPDVPECAEDARLPVLGRAQALAAQLAPVDVIQPALETVPAVVRILAPAAAETVAACALPVIIVPAAATMIVPEDVPEDAQTLDPDVSFTMIKGELSMTNPVVDVSSYIIALQSGSVSDELRARARKAIVESADAREPVRVANNIIHTFATQYRSGKISVDDAIDGITQELDYLGITYYDMTLEAEPLRILIGMEQFVFGNSYEHMVKAYDIMSCNHNSKVKQCYAYTILKELLNYDIGFTKIDQMKELNEYLHDVEIDQVMLLVTKLVYELVLYRGLDLGS